MPLTAELPGPDTLWENAECAQEYTKIESLPSDPVFAKGQYIAKACALKDGGWEFFVGRINGLTAAGPWLAIEGERDWKQVMRFPDADAPASLLKYCPSGARVA